MSIDNANNRADSDIKSMMNEVIAHITDADRRSTASLRQMQERLEALGQEARSVRHGVPAQYLPGFDRIEDGMTLLANRIAQSYAARHQAPVMDMNPPTRPTMPKTEPAQTEAYVPPQASVDTPPATAYTPPTWSDHAQPNPLSSNSPGLLRARPKAYAPNVDTFDVIETMPDTSTDPWSPDQAAALVDVYTGAEAVVPLPQPANPAPVPAPVVVQGLAVSDKTWLDARLSDIATRVEQSLAESRSGKAIASMEQRLEDFEQRMITTLGSVATKGDIDALAGMETQIRDLRAQFEVTHTELMRIDDLERQLAHIAQQTSHDELSAVMSRFAPAAQAETVAERTDIEFHSIAIAAAEAAASRVANASRDSSRNGRVDDVHAMLADFIQERRQGEEQTANTLDTLQQAMLRILDRVDAIDVGPVHAAPADGHYIPAAHAYADHIADHPEPVRQPQQTAPAARFEAEERAAPIPAGDYLAQQRAKMQASVQRAAAAQREKLKAQQEAGEQKSASARPAKSTPPAGSRRLMVSGLALAVVAGGVGAFAMMTGTRDQSVSAAAPVSAPVSASPVAGQLSKPKPMFATPADSATKTTTTLHTDAIQATNTVPETVTDSLNDRDVAPDLDQLADANAARNQTGVPSPMRGILLQGQPVPETRSAETAKSSQPTVNATQIAARPTDLDIATQQPPATDGQPRAALDLPPATVGPLSLRLAAAQGDSSAEFEVASRLAEGKGTDQNLKEAVRWYQRSATQGFAQAQYRLATFYERGLGMKADVARARTWYQRAADQGNVKAMHNLAVLAAGRSAESPDYTTAARWFTQAASYGLPDSQFNLAVLTESGLGVEKDMVQAAMWFTIAARSGDKEATRRRDLMKSKMDAKDLAAADHLVKTWQQLVPEKMANDPRAAGEAWKSRQASSSEPR